MVSGEFAGMATSEAFSTVAHEPALTRLTIYIIYGEIMGANLMGFYWEIGTSFTY